MKTFIENPSELTWNEVTLRGRVGANMDIIEEGGKKSAHFYLGVGVIYKKFGKDEIDTHWYKVSVYKEHEVATAEKLQQHDCVEVRGKLSTIVDSWTKKKEVQIIVGGEKGSLEIMQDPEQLKPHNTVTLIGNITDSPDVFYHNSELFASMTMAINDKWTDKETGEKFQKAHWCTVLLTGKGGVEFAREHLSKGDCIEVTGRVSQEKWAKDGVEQARPRITISEQSQIRILEFKKKDHDIGRDTNGVER